MIMSMYKKIPRICITNRSLLEGNTEKEKQDALIRQVKKIMTKEPIPQYIILREKDLGEEDYETLAKRMLAECSQIKEKLILHFYPEVARKLGIRRIHLPLYRLEEMTKEDKRVFDEIGVSIHSMEQAKRAVELGAAYMTAGHIFATQCKPGLEPRGLLFLSSICKENHVKVYAIGGIEEENMESCIEAGAAGVCQTSWYMER